MDRIPVYSGSGLVRFHCIALRNNEIAVNWRRVWIYQRGNQNSYIEEIHTTQWPKEKKRKKEKQRSTKHAHKSNDRVTRTLLKPEGEPRAR